MRMLLIAMVIIPLAACVPVQSVSTTIPIGITPNHNQILAVTTTPTTQASFNPTATQTARPAPSSTLTTTTQMCSPLQDIALGELPDIVSNPFVAPRPGQDDGHHGTDFAYYSRGEHKSMMGLGVYSIFAGNVTAVIQNRPPYGNMVIVETPLRELPQNLISHLTFPDAPTPQPGSIHLTCPTPQASLGWSSGEKSLYLLYAHLNKSPDVNLGERVACGQVLGGVGNTGFSGNPHLHLEVRQGPPGATFEGMSHYNAAATSLEMENYCTWRVSGIFQMIDPLKLISAGISVNPLPTPSP